MDYVNIVESSLVRVLVVRGHSSADTNDVNDDVRGYRNDHYR